MSKMNLHLQDNPNARLCQTCGQFYFGHVDFCSEDCYKKIKNHPGINWDNIKISPNWQ